MNQPRLLAIIIGVTLLVGLIDFWTSAELVGSALFILPLILCVTQRSKWVLWSTASAATLLSIAVGIWNFHHTQALTPRALSPWLALANRALLIGSLLALATLIHLWINRCHQAALDAAKIERNSNNLMARNEQLENELTKIKAANRGKRKPLVLTIKQYLSFAAQLSDRHRTMVVTAMCSGMRVPEVLSLRWDQVDFVTGLLSAQQSPVNAPMSEPKTGMAKEEIPMDPVLVEALLEWRNKSPGAGLVFPSHITGRCYHPGPIQQDYFRPAARKLGLGGLCWNTFRNSYNVWIDEEGSSAGVQQKLLRHPAVPTIANNSNGASKPKAKANGKIARRIPPPPAEALPVPTEAS
jgi:integrase